MLASLACAAGALLYVVEVSRFAIADRQLAQVQRLLDSGKPQQAAEMFRPILSDTTALVRAPIYFSRRWIQVSATSTDVRTKLIAAQLAWDSAVAATREPESRANAWYNLATLSAIRNDGAGTEACLREAIRASPSWFKPHWTLARLSRRARAGGGGATRSRYRSRPGRRQTSGGRLQPG